MSTDYEHLYAEIYQAPGPRETIALYEELIRLADSNQDIDVAYDARREYASIACEEGFPEKGLVAFSWCLAQFDKDNQRDSAHSLIWQYKVMLELIPIFDTVSREQIVRLQEDMAKRLARMNCSERTAHYYRSWNLMRMGDYDQAFDFHQKYLAMKRDDMSDCKACELDRQIELHARMHKDNEALELAGPILDGAMRCGEVPHFTNGHVVKPLIRLGRNAEATDRAERGYKLVTGQRKYLGTIGELLLVRVRDRSLDKGMRCFAKHLPWAAQCAAGEWKLRFYSAVALLLEAYAQERPAKKKLAIPREMSCYREDDKYDMMELAHWFASETSQLAERFNNRNGNRRYDELLADNRQAAGLA